MKRTRVPPRNLPATSNNVVPLPAPPIRSEPKPGMFETNWQAVAVLGSLSIASTAFMVMTIWGVWSLAAVIVPASR